MKKQFLFLVLTWILTFSSFAQTEETPLSFGERRQIRKALKVEAYTQDGTQHTGYLYYADAEKIYLTKNPLMKGSLIAIQAEDIYQIKVISRIPFAKRFLSGLTFSAAVMTLLTAEMYSHGDAIMIGPDFVIVAGTVFFGTPFSFLTTLILPKERTDFEYRTTGNPDALNLTSKFMEKRQISSIHPSTENVKLLSVLKDTEELENILEPLKSLHPEATKNVHIMFGGTGSLINLGRQLDRIYTVQGLKTGYYRTDAISFTGKLQANVSDKIRPYLSFTFGETGYGSGVLLPEPEDSEYIYTNYSIFYGHLGVDYVLNPQNNTTLSPFEFSVGGGLSYAKLNYDYTPGYRDFFSQKIKKSYTSYGVQLGARVDYFVSRHLSLNLALTTDLMYPIKMDEMHYESVSLGSLVFDGGHFNTSSGQIHFGLGVHF